MQKMIVEVGADRLRVLVKMPGVPNEAARPFCVEDHGEYFEPKGTRVSDVVKAIEDLTAQERIPKMIDGAGICEE